MKQLLGTGLVSWPNSERISDRYGMITLFRPGEGPSEVGLQPLPWQADINALEGKRGAFVAVLNGQELDLGAGTFFTEPAWGTTYVGLKPDDGREEQWLNVDNLYKVDAFLIRTPVDLYFVPTN